MRPSSSTCPWRPGRALTCLELANLRTQAGIAGALSPDICANLEVLKLGTGNTNADHPPACLCDAGGAFTRLRVLSYGSDRRVHNLAPLADPAFALPSLEVLAV